MRNLMELLPTFYENSDIVSGIQNGFNKEVEALNNAQVDLINQLFIDTATWSLDLWDKFTGVYTNGYDVSDRRKIIKSKLITQPNFTKEKIVNILKALVDDAYIVEDNENYTFDMYLKTRNIISEKINTVIKEIEAIKPAHLDYRIILGYIVALVSKERFLVWESNSIPICGTIDVSYNNLIVTEGKQFGSRIVDKVNSYNSDVIAIVSEGRYFGLVDGKTIVEAVKGTKINYSSEVIASCSAENYCKGGDK